MSWVVLWVLCCIENPINATIGVKLLKYQQGRRNSSQVVAILVFIRSNKLIKYVIIHVCLLQLLWLESDVTPKEYIDGLLHFDPDHDPTKEMMMPRSISTAAQSNCKRPNPFITFKSSKNRRSTMPLQFSIRLKTFLLSVSRRKMSMNTRWPSEISIAMVGASFHICPVTCSKRYKYDLSSIWKLDCFYFQLLKAFHNWFLWKGFGCWICYHCSIPNRVLKSPASLRCLYNTFLWIYFITILRARKMGS